jgi:NADH-quinone oxidoreductase subunit N
LNWFLISPELSLAVVAVLVIMLDLVMRRQHPRALAAVSLLGLAIPFVLTILLIGRRETGLSDMLAIDTYAVFFKFFFLIAAGLVILASPAYARRRLLGHVGEYYALILFSTIGMMLMASTRELISMYIALELTSISLYVLVGLVRTDMRSREASLKYLLLGAFSSALLLYGMALLYGLTGVTDFAQISARVTESTVQPALIMSVVLMAAGLGFKIAAVPFHMWVPDVYEGAPTPITAFLSVGSKAAGFAALIRLFGFALPGIQDEWAIIFAVIAAATMTIGNVIAIAQNNIKRLLAYSSIAHAGYTLVGVAALSQEGLSSVLFYLLAYMLTNLGAFIAVIAFTNAAGREKIDSFAGLYRRNPALALGMTICLLSLGGIPPMVGFWSKFYLFAAAWNNGLSWLVVLGLVNSAVSLYYYLRVVRQMYFVPAEEEEPKRLRVSPAITVAMGIAVIGVLAVGLYPGFIHIAEAAARSFF